MKIISYNVNGIRAALKKGFVDWLKTADPDVICLQEIKAEKEQLDLSVFNQAGYNYNYWFSAKKKGYSGVAILSKTKPIDVVFGTGIESMDFEGRNIRVDFEDLSIMSLYLPSGTNIARLEHKLEYMDLFQDYVNKKEGQKRYIKESIYKDYTIESQGSDRFKSIRKYTLKVSDEDSYGKLKQFKHVLTPFHFFEVDDIDTGRKYYLQPN